MVQAERLGRRPQQQVVEDNNEENEGYDSEEEPFQGEDGPDELDWRMDPEKSWSDWTIVIRTSTDDSAKADSQAHPHTRARFRARCSRITLEDVDDDDDDDDNVTDDNGSINSTTTTETHYHVHKVVLAVGKRKSHYFRRLFQSNAFAESTSHTSYITLEQPFAADAFPVMLDYVYGAAAGKKLDIHERNATALHYLGQYFKNPQLRWEAKQFWKTNLNLTNCHVYYQHARLLCDEKILHAIESLCAADPLGACSNDALFLVVENPRFWLSVLDKIPMSSSLEEEEDETTGGCNPRHVRSSIVERVLQKHAAAAAAPAMDQTHFEELTNSSRLPVVVGFPFVQTLLCMEKELSNEEVKEGLTSLQERCVQGLVNELEAMTAADFNTARQKEKEMVDFLQMQNPFLSSWFLRKRLDAVCAAYTRLEHENQKQKSDIFKLTVNITELHGEILRLCPPPWIQNPQQPFRS